MARVLVVDDDEHICSVFRQFLEQEGHEPLIASGGQDAVKMVVESRPDLVIMDVRMPGMDGLEALKRIRALEPETYVVIMTAYGTSQTSIEAMRLGAFDYLNKPLDLDVVEAVIDKVIEAQELTRAAESADPEDAEKYALVNLVGKSDAMQEAYKLIGRLTASDVQVLIVGERGVGKELVAHTIHFNSARKERPFVTIDCRDLPDEVLEVELFGREEPASGIIERAIPPGKLELADGGTLAINDVDAMALPAQAKLARFLESGQFERVSGTGSVTVDVRVIATTEEDLAEEVRLGTFSDDLYGRLSVVYLSLPPLRSRRADIPELVQHFLQQCAAGMGANIAGIEDAGLKLLSDYDWPGNVGELENVVKRACVLARGKVITVDEVRGSLEAVPAPMRGRAESELPQAARRALRDRLRGTGADDEGSPFHEILAGVEAALVAEALEMTGGNQVKAAKMLGLNRTTLRKKMSLYER